MIGYTTGVWDLFHVGHVRLIQAAATMCDHLIVGVQSDELVKANKGSFPVIPFNERYEIIEALLNVDTVVVENDLNKSYAHQNIGFDILFVGDDHLGEERWDEYENELERVGVKFVYLPYTEHISSTKLKERLKNT